MSNEQKIQTPNSVLTPEAQAFMNQSISAAVREVFLQMAPMMQSIALTPEKLAEAERIRREPDPNVKAREIRERLLMKEDLDAAREQKERMQANCTHKDPNMRWAVSLIHNYPDRQTRGVCVHCHSLFEPTHWEIGAPDATHPRGNPVLVKAHAQYHIVREVEASIGQ